MPKSSYVIAVLDDDDMVREALHALLSASGYTVELYDSADSFLTALAATRAHCLMIDIELGGVSGISLGRDLAAEGFVFPIIYMTGSANDLLRRRAIEAGAVAFLSKPFTPAALLAALDVACARRAPCA